MKNLELVNNDKEKCNSQADSYLSLLGIITDVERDNPYNSPRASNDKRIREVWDRITKDNLKLKFVSSDDCTDLAPTSDSMIKYFQPRADTILGGDEDYYIQFYKLNNRREEMPFATRIDGVLYMILGWKRARAHEHAIKIKGNESKFDYIEIIFPKDMSINTILAVCNKLARMGNKKVNSVREETTGDYSFQVETAYELECMNNIKAKKWSTKKLIAWAKKWVIDEISKDYGHPTMASQLGNIVNRAFAEHRGQSLPFPSDEEINLNAKRFFPNLNWLENTGNTIKTKCSSRLDKITEKHSTIWLKDLPPSLIRTPAYLTLRVGKTLDSAINSTKSIDEGIVKALKEIKNYYTNPAVLFAGMPMPTKILFVKQMNKGDYRAFEWEEDLQEYVEVFEIK